MTKDKHYDLLTVDVWDTLLRRRCHPDSVKLHVCRYLLLHHSNDLPEDIRDTWILLRLRQQAEKELGDRKRAEGLDDEYHYIEVYDHWLAMAQLASPTHGSEKRTQLLQKLAEIELEQECYVTYPDDTIDSVLSSVNAKKRYFLSDFYMPAEPLRQLLRHHGLEQWIADGVVSCEIGLNKRSGRLYQHMHQEFTVKPENHLHIGDNPHADIAAAKRLGIQSIHHQPEFEHQIRQQHERDFTERKAALYRAITQSTEGLPPPIHPAHELGRRTALLWTGFALFIQQQAVKNNNEVVYFFTREGEFYLQIYNALAKGYVLGSETPPAQLLEVSRVATFAASLGEVSPESLMRLWRQYSNQSPAGLLRSLGLDPKTYTNSLERHGLAPDELVVYPWQDPRVLAFLSDAETKKKINSHLVTAKNTLLDYLESQGISKAAGGNIGIVDIGWRGTIQDNLAHTLGGVQWHGYYLALNQYLNPQPKNVHKHAWGPDRNKNEQYSNLLDTVTPLEMLCNSPHGSVTGYRHEKNAIVAERLIDKDENGIYEEAIKHYQAGVLETLPFWADYLRTHAYTADELRPTGMALWSEIIKNPPNFLAQAYFRLNHNEIFGLGRFIDKKQQIHALNILRATYSSEHRAQLKQFLSETGWHDGLMANPDTPSQVKLALRLVLKGAAIRRKLLGS